jgi:hypothetical protein
VQNEKRKGLSWPYVLPILNYISPLCDFHSGLSKIQEVVDACFWFLSRGVVVLVGASVPLHPRVA